MKYLLRSFVFILFMGFSSHSFAERPATLPGGLVFPSFSTAALVNTASLAFDWRTEIKALYSPPLNSTDAHSYLASSAYSNGRLGLNLGYTGSYQSGTAFNSAFGGAAFRLGRLAVGSAFRKLELASGDPLQVDVSGVFRVNRRIRLGASIYNLGEEQQVGLGVGFEKPLELTFQADILFPMNPKGNSLSDQYSANAVITSYYKRFAYSAGVRYNRQQDGFNNSNQLVANLGLNYRLTHYLNLSAQYQSNPQSLGIGIVWGWTPPADQYTKIFQEQI